MLSLFPAAIEGVEVTSINSTAVEISWNGLIISGTSIDSYVVVYRQMPQNFTIIYGKKRAMFNGFTTSGVITDIHAEDMYMFQVFAIITVDGRRLEGERSDPVYFISE